LSNNKKMEIKLDNGNLSVIGKISPAGIFRTDIHWNCSFVNDKWCEITGFSYEQALGTGWCEVLHPEDIDELKKEWQSHDPTGAPVTKEHRLLTRKKEIKWVLTRIATEISNGKPAGFIGSVTDITESKKTQQALRESEKLNREVVENSPNAILIHTHDARIVFANNAAARVLDSESPSLLTEKAMYDFLSQNDQEGLRRNIDITLDKGKVSAPFELEITTLEGSEKYIESIAIPFHWKDENAILLVNRDITDQKLSLKKLESSEKNLKSFIKNAPVAVAMLDKNMNYVMCSRRWLGDWWKKAEEMDTESIIGKNHYDLFPDVTDYWKKVHKRALKGAYEANEEDYFITEEGKAEWLRWEVRPWRTTEDKIAGLIIYTEFITERKKAEKNLMLLADELMASNEELQQFAYITSHNLRAPIVNIDTLLGFYDPSNAMSDDNRQIFDKILLSFDQLKSSLNDLIKLVDLKKVQYTTKESVVFEDILKKVLRNIDTQVAAEKARIDYDFSRAPKVLFQSSVLESVLQNLITNALKYRRDEAPVIEVKTDSIEDHVLMTISDNGLGMDLNKIGSKLFGMYQRFHEGKEGKGLGLYIVRSQIESLGGKIEVESETNQGTTFKVYIKK